MKFFNSIHLPVYGLLPPPLTSGDTAIHKATCLKKIQISVLKCIKKEDIDPAGKQQAEKGRWRTDT
jgi:hypothetical protein